MFRGLISIFSSGLILNPLFILGVASGAFLSHRFSEETIFGIFTDYEIYLVAVAIAFVYTFAFRQVYKGYSKVVDWNATFERFVGYSGMLIITSILSAIFFEFWIF